MQREEFKERMKLCKNVAEMMHDTGYDLVTCVHILMYIQYNLSSTIIKDMYRKIQEENKMQDTVLSLAFDMQEFLQKNPDKTELIIEAMNNHNTHNMCYFYKIYTYGLTGKEIELAIDICRIGHLNRLSWILGKSMLSKFGKNPIIVDALNKCIMIDKIRFLFEALEIEYDEDAYDYNCLVDSAAVYIALCKVR